MLVKSIFKSCIFSLKGSTTLCHFPVAGGALTNFSSEKFLFFSNCMAHDRNSGHWYAILGIRDIEDLSKCFYVLNVCCGKSEISNCYTIPCVYQLPCICKCVLNIHLF